MMNEKLKRSKELQECINVAIFDCPICGKKPIILTNGISLARIECSGYGFHKHRKVSVSVKRERPSRIIKEIVQKWNRLQFEEVRFIFDENGNPFHEENKSIDIDDEQRIDSIDSQVVRTPEEIVYHCICASCYACTGCYEENEYLCGTCKYHYHGKDMLDGDFCCVNDESDNCSEYTMYDDYCEEWADRYETD